MIEHAQIVADASAKPRTELMEPASDPPYNRHDPPIGLGSGAEDQPLLIANLLIKRSVELRKGDYGGDTFAERARFAALAELLLQAAHIIRNQQCRIGVLLHEQWLAQWSLDEATDRLEAVMAQLDAGVPSPPKDTCSNP